MPDISMPENIIAVSSRARCLLDESQVENGLDRMAVKISVEFKAQMNWPGHVDIGTSVVRMGRTSMVIGGALFVDGSCTSTSECIMVCVDPETSRPTEIPDSLRQRFLAREL